MAELVGSLVGYGVGRAGGRPLVHRWGRYLLITRADINRAERFVAGFLEVPPSLFGVLSLIGTAVWVTTMSLIGYGVGSAWQGVAHGIAVAGYGPPSRRCLPSPPSSSPGFARSGWIVSEPGGDLAGQAAGPRVISSRAAREGGYDRICRARAALTNRLSCPGADGNGGDRCDRDCELVRFASTG